MSASVKAAMHMWWRRYLYVYMDSFEIKSRKAWSSLIGIMILIFMSIMSAGVKAVMHGVFRKAFQLKRGCKIQQ